MENVNFKWLVDDIYDSIILKLFYKDNSEDNLCGTYEVYSILDVDMGEFDIKFANIADMTKLLNSGMVRFFNLLDTSDFIDIPFRNIYKLYQNSNSIEENFVEKKIKLDDIEAFAIVDGSVVSQNYFLSTSLVSKPTDDLFLVMEVADTFSELGMQEKMNALSNINMINYRRVQRDSKSK